MKRNFLFTTCLFFTTICFGQPGVNDSLILYMPFNGNANDISGNNNNGIVTNATLTTDRFNTPNSAYNFNGNNSYILIAPSSSLSKIYTSNEVTISAWINIRNWYQGVNVFAILEQYNPSTDLSSILFEANWAAQGILFEAGESVNYIGCNYSWNFNAWHHIALTYSATLGTAKFYVDSLLLCTKPYSPNFPMDSVHSFAIGRSLSGPDEYSDGMIDELRVYNRVLSDSEINVLPLQLISFEGELQNGNAVLKWQTSKEINTSKFIIEKSAGQMEFLPVGTVTAANNTNINKNYAFTDEKPYQGINFYRLKMMDRDGKFTYSKVVNLKLTNLSGAAIFPNPVASTATIKLQAQHAENIEIKVVSSEGKVLSTKGFNLMAGSNLIPVNTKSLTKGVYAVIIAGQNTNEHLRFIKQ